MEKGSVGEEERGREERSEERARPRSRLGEGGAKRMRGGGWLPRYRMRWPLTRVVCRGRHGTPDGESPGTLGVHRGACGRSLRDSAHPGTSSFRVEPRSRRARPTSRTTYLPIILPHFGCLLWSSCPSLSFLSELFRRKRASLATLRRSHRYLTLSRSVYVFIHGVWKMVERRGSKGKEVSREGNGRGSGWLAI